MNSNFFERNDLMKYIAGYLLSIEEGQQLLSTRELAEQHDASVGSISAAVKNLEEIGAVTIDRRGWQGSFLAKKNYGMLWKVTENGPLVVALTLPSFPKCEGLATGLYSLFERAGIEAYLIFIRGSFNRIKALRNGRCHATVMSVLAAEELCGGGEEILLRLPPQSFVTDHRVFFRKGVSDSTHPLRVGIDNDSFDIKYLTELEFKDRDVEFHPMTFMQTDLHMEQSPVDAAISNQDHLERMKNTGITSRPLSPAVQEIMGNRDTSAAVVIRAGEPATRLVLQQVLDSRTLSEIQQQVVTGQIVPQY